MINPFRIFLISGAIAIIVVTAALSLSFRLYAIDELIDSTERLNDALAQSYWAAIQNGKDRINVSDYVSSASRLDAGALRGWPQTRRLHAAVATLTKGSAVLRVEIYDTRGLTVYSSEPGRIGVDAGSDPAFRSTLQGSTPPSKLSHHGSFETFGSTVEDRSLVESLLPFHRGDGALGGVLKLYADVTPAVADIWVDTIKLAVGLPLCLVLLYALLYFAVRSAHGARRRRRRDRQHTDTDRDMAQQTIEKLVEQSGATLRTIVEHAIDAIILVDSEGNIEWFNRTAEQIFGYHFSEVVGKNIEVLIPERLRDAHRESFILRANGFKTADRVIGKVNELEGLRRDGKVFPLEVSIGEIRAGGKIGYVGTVRDITERKQTQEQLVHSQKMEAIGQLTGGVAHEFNNLLTAIGGFARMALRSTEDSERVEKCITEVVKASDQAAALTSQMLAFGRKQASQPGPVHIPDLLDELRSMLQPLVNDDIEIATQCERDCGGHASIDPSQIKQAVLNLAINGAQSMPDGGILTIRCGVTELDQDFVARFPRARPGRHVAVAVTDSGTGIDDEALKHIFEPFFTTKEMGKGTGLGLSFVYGLVEQAEGVLNVETEVGTGTTFTIYLPLVEPEELAESDECTVDEVASKAAEEKTILVAEDKPRVRELAKLVLEEHGYNVLAAADGIEAARVYLTHKGRIDLLLTDVAMPGKPGPKLARELLAEQPDLKIIFMSGHSAMADFETDEDASENRFLQKPFSPEELTKVVDELLTAPVPHESPHTPQQIER